VVLDKGAVRMGTSDWNANKVRVLREGEAGFPLLVVFLLNAWKNMLSVVVGSRVVYNPQFW